MQQSYTWRLAIPFPPALRSRMETAFAADFADVRLYLSDLPHQSGAQAVTQGNTIHFRSDCWQPNSAQGVARLAHELTHIWQQRRGLVTGYAGEQQLHWERALETQAEQVGSLLANGADALVGELLAALQPAPANPAMPPANARTYALSA